MNWEAIGAIAELVGAIGVIVSLVYLATQIRQSRKQTQQNTKAIEAQVTWAHFEATRDIYLNRVPESQRLKILSELRVMEGAAVQSLETESFEKFMQVSHLIGTEYGYWQARFLTQSDQEERQILANHIRVNVALAFPAYRAYWDRVSTEGLYYRSEFVHFVDEIFSQIDAD